MNSERTVCKTTLVYHKCSFTTIVWHDIDKQLQGLEVQQNYLTESCFGINEKWLIHNKAYIIQFDRSCLICDSWQCKCSWCFLCRLRILKYVCIILMGSHLTLDFEIWWWSFLSHHCVCFFISWFLRN